MSSKTSSIVFTRVICSGLTDFPNRRRPVPVIAKTDACVLGVFNPNGSAKTFGSSLGSRTHEASRLVSTRPGSVLPISVTCGQVGPAYVRYFSASALTLEHSTGS